VIQTRLTQKRGYCRDCAAMPRVSTAHTKRAPSARELLALNVLRLRGRLGWSQEALAFEAGLHRTSIAHVERQARNISLDNIERIAVALGVRVHEMLMPKVNRAGGQRYGLNHDLDRVAHGNQQRGVYPDCTQSSTHGAKFTLGRVRRGF
jgi:transcriptional regulator with XRE-family HTH domain